MKGRRKMDKYKNAVHQATTKVAQGIAAYYMALAITDTASTVEIFVLSFGFIWLGTEVALWFYNFIVKPSALAIYESTK